MASPALKFPAVGRPRGGRERTRVPSSLTVKTFTVTQLLTAAQAAEFLQLQTRSLYAMVRAARSQVRRPVNPIPFRKVGHELRFQLAELDEWTKRASEC